MNHDLIYMLGLAVAMAFPAMFVLCGFVWALERCWKKVEILAGLFEFLVYRKQFHKWRKSDPELTPGGDRPAH